jgi:hypothetical protein
METSMEFIKQIKNRTAMRSSNSIPGRIANGNEISVSKDICISMFIAVLFIVGKLWNQIKCASVDEWIM